MNFLVSISPCRFLVNRALLIQPLQIPAIRPFCRLSKISESKPAVLEIYRRFATLQSYLPPEKQVVQDRAKHEIDRLNPENWRLIYYNNKHEEYDDYEYLITAISVASNLFAVLAGLVLFFIFPEHLVDENRRQSRDAQSEFGLIAGSFAYAIIFLLGTRWRRLRVLRLYESIASPGKKSAIKFENESGLLKRLFAKTTEEAADYCIVWKTASLVGSKRCFYKKKEAKEARERADILAMFLGNYRARGRKWCVYKKYFLNQNDIQKVFGKK